MTNRRPPIPGIIALVIMCSLILSLGAWLFLPDLVRVMALRMMPPAYPGMELLDHVERLEFGTGTDETTFRARAQVYGVRSWMEQRMPGFKTCVTDTSYLPECSTNVICDTSLISKAMIWVLMGETGLRRQACVAVVLLPVTEDDRYTLIRYTVSWPAPMDDAQ